MEINVENRKKKISICKLPKYLSDYIKQQQNKDFGEVTISNTGTITLNLNPNNKSLIPTEYNIKKINKPLSNMCVLTSTSSTSDLDGIIDSEFVITPIINKNYMQFKKQQSNKILHNTEVIDCMNEGLRIEKIGNLREMEYLARKRKQMLISKKRERLDKKDVLDIVFNAFEKYNSWTVKDLADFTGQPLAFIQEIVNEICDVDKKEHKNSYTLKDEYK